MFQSYNFTVSERFIRYVQIDTQSDPQSASHPSTEKQKDLGRLLVKELKEINIAEVELDDFGYLLATIPSNTEKNVPVICFCAHLDTSPDCSGRNVKPILHKNYAGENLILPDDPSQVITKQLNPYLAEKTGEDLI
ncbi:MAG TPA: peptidase T, partial [Puia sp.]|nr:peptidase T [Puia sp.]